MNVRGASWAILLSVVFVLLGVLFFFQTKDPMLLAFGVQAAAWTWGILLIVHILTRGIPVRIVSDERENK